MADDTTTPGRRVPSATGPWLLEPGDYLLRDGALWFATPNGVGPGRIDPGR